MVDQVSFGTVKPVAAKPSQANVPVRKNGVATNVSNAKIESTQSLPELIALAKQLFEQGAPIDYQKVAQVRTAIAQGTYHSNSEDVASAILGFAAKEVK